MAGKKISQLARQGIPNWVPLDAHCGMRWAIREKVTWLMSGLLYNTRAGAMRAARSYTVTHPGEWGVVRVAVVEVRRGPRR